MFTKLICNGREILAWEPPVTNPTIAPMKSLGPENLRYRDSPLGTMIETEDGGGHFTEVIFHPRVTVKADSNLDLAEELHAQAHHLCFIANSMNFPVRWEASVQLQELSPGNPNPL